MTNLFKYLLFTTVFCIVFSGCKKVERDYYRNGRLKSEIEYRNGKEHGKMIFYNEHYPKPSLEITMKNGKKHGELKRYFFNGNIEATSYFVDDVQEGVECIYELYGAKLIEAHYVNGKKNGPYTSWHEKDVIKEQGAFVDDLFDGEWLFWDDRGLLVGEAFYEKGTGVQYSYDSKGNIHRITHYVNNMKNGEDIYFTSAGDTLKVITHVDDRIEHIREY